MNHMQRIVDLTWVPWTYASILALLLGTWAGNRFPALGPYGDPAFDLATFVVGALLAFFAASPLILAFYIASRMVNNQVEFGARVALVAEYAALRGQDVAD